MITSLAHLVASPFEVPLLLGRTVLIDEHPHSLPTVIELVQIVPEDGLLLVGLHEGVSLLQLVVLVRHALEQLNREQYTV
jgi:hypothetical protein